MMIVGLMTFSVACKDDDKVNCDKIEDQIDDAEDDLDEAWDDGDCERIGEIYDDLIEVVKKGKSCEYVKDIMEEVGADNIDELVDFLEEIRDEDVDDCENPPTI